MQYPDLFTLLPAPNAWNLLLPSLSALAVSAVGSLAVWRLCFHPLSKIPGPWLGAVSDYYLMYYDIIKDGGMTKKLEELHRQYGPVVRFGPNKIHFNDLEAYDAIYRDVRFPKEAWFYKGFLTPTASAGLTNIRDARERRRLILPFFSRQSILKLENVIQDAVDRFINTLSSKIETQEVCDLHRGFLCVAMEVITMYCFGKRYGAIEYPNYDFPFMLALKNSHFSVFLIQHFPFLKHVLLNVPEWLARRLAPEMMAIPTFRKQLEDQIAETLGNPASLTEAENRTIYQHMLDPTHRHRELGALELFEEGMALVAGGTETTGNALGMAAYHVLANPLVSRRLLEELLEAWPDVEDSMPLEKLEKLPYLTGVVFEALRLSHGTVTPLPRVVSEDSMIGGVLVPKGTIASMGQSFVHLNPDVFPNPTKFEPLRWSGEKSKTLQHYLVPFSKGQRVCFGQTLATAELYLILSNLFRKVDLTLVDTTEKDLEWRALLMPRYRGRIQAKVVRLRKKQKV